MNLFTKPAIEADVYLDGVKVESLSSDGHAYIEVKDRSIFSHPHVEIRKGDIFHRSFRLQYVASTPVAMPEHMGYVNRVKNGGESFYDIVFNTSVLQPIKAPSIIGVNSSKDNWLIGNWVFDKKKTISEAEVNGFQMKKSNFFNFKNGRSVLFKMLINQLENVIYKISSSDISVTQEGNGQFVKYSIFERPTENSITIKKDDGGIETYHLEGNRIWIKPTMTGFQVNEKEALDLRIYLKKIQ